jgi:hypothetical protein
MDPIPILTFLCSETSISYGAEVVTLLNKELSPEDVWGS